jgi:large subunit ribosomal protein L9
MAEFEIRSLKEKERAQELSGKIESMSITLSRKAGEKGKLYGSVTNMDVAEAIVEQGVQVNRRKIRLTEPIKALGDYDVAIKLHTDVTAMVRVSVVPQEEAE